MFCLHVSLYTKCVWPVLKKLQIHNEQGCITTDQWQDILLKLKAFDYISESQPSKFLMFHNSTLSFIFNKYVCWTGYWLSLKFQVLCSLEYRNAFHQETVDRPGRQAECSRGKSEMSAHSFSTTLFKLVSSTVLTVASPPIALNPPLEYFKWCHAYNAQFITPEVLVFGLSDLTKGQWKYFCVSCWLTPRFTFFHFWKDLCLGTQGSSVCECWAEDSWVTTVFPKGTSHIMTWG